MSLHPFQMFVTVTAKNLEAAANAFTEAIAPYPNARVTSLVEQTNTTTRFGVVSLLAVVDHE
ncbi:hypothetical protein [Frondihabitans sp. PAMC 28766]|uniref:hypothetical protein n=1 Tax=Frondihabitans sp. PAMC 28766 TaxID=1795630 RepID=UPI0012FF98B4|nr:hypothetical protein [Frondihabitans sp. PAMC 28766]